MSNALFTGAGGMLGNAYATLKAQYSRELNVNCIFTDKVYSDHYISELLDVTDKNSFKLLASECKPMYLFHLAAITSLEECELNKDQAFETNTESVRTACEIAREHNSFLIYITTAGVHDGKDIFYAADAPAKPISTYGKSKWESELIVSEMLDSSQYLILRAGWMMGGGIKHDKKFVAKILRQLLSGVTTIYAVDDLYGSPTYTMSFAINNLNLLKSNAHGKVNNCTVGSPSRFDVARVICEWYTNVSMIQTNVVPVSSDYFKQEYFAERPKNESMKIDNFREIIEENTWKKSLLEYLQTSWLTECSKF